MIRKNLERSSYPAGSSGPEGRKRVEPTSGWSPPPARDSHAVICNETKSGSAVASTVSPAGRLRTKRSEGTVFRFASAAAWKSSCVSVIAGKKPTAATGVAAAIPRPFPRFPTSATKCAGSVGGVPLLAHVKSACGRRSTRVRSISRSPRPGALFACPNTLVNCIRAMFVAAVASTFVPVTVPKIRTR